MWSGIWGVTSWKSQPMQACTFITRQSGNDSCVMLEFSSAHIDCCAPAVARPIAVRTPSGTALRPFTARLRAPAVAPCQLTSAHGQRVT